MPMTRREMRVRCCACGACFPLAVAARTESGEQSDSPALGRLFASRKLAAAYHAEWSKCKYAKSSKGISRPGNQLKRMRPRWPRGRCPIRRTIMSIRKCFSCARGHSS